MERFHRKSCKNKSESQPAFCRVQSSGTQSVNSDANANVIFNTAVYDNRSHFAIGTPDRITLKETGIYSLHGCVAFDTNSVDDRFLTLTVNSSEIAQVRIGANPAAGDTIISVSTIAKLDINDEVFLVVRQSSGGALNIETQLDKTNILSVARIG